MRSYINQIFCFSLRKISHIDCGNLRSLFVAYCFVRGLQVLGEIYHTFRFKRFIGNALSVPKEIASGPFDWAQDSSQ